MATQGHTPRIQASERLVSLDAVRGITVSVMIFVDFLGNWIYPSVVNHSTWNGEHHTHQPVHHCDA